ncbi:winged helix-turn-helix transcriptional regulator [Desulfofundulus thermobenzoicus]|uniref:Winged helix-turn-helix transcriptional regulator n=1 Tax=Desulfofundulus thermobenzoicus TaxID=29376 RepID=A0A6N7IRF9_9FIRM|nr:Lrp/AsnC family transcriptional regulator [Desulfofundulus thermobenzoicus]MQL52676.1 winged helix-turn-helix transcriptional regulator [Desulfofundulus thermobenzoicus]
MQDAVKEILEILENNSRLKPEEIAVMLNLDAGKVRETIAALEENKTILKYMTLVNWEKVGEEKVSALIEVRITPQRDVGFDGVAERIYRYPEVRSVRLMSGAYDLAVFIEGRTMREVSHFVATRLATIEGVISTTTHFVLKTYKQDGVIVEDGEENRRLKVTP